MRLFRLIGLLLLHGCRRGRGGLCLWLLSIRRIDQNVDMGFLLCRLHPLGLWGRSGIHCLLLIGLLLLLRHLCLLLYVRLLLLRRYLLRVVRSCVGVEFCDLCCHHSRMSSEFLRVFLIRIGRHLGTLGLG